MSKIGPTQLPISIPPSHRLPSDRQHIETPRHGYVGSPQAIEQEPMHSSLTLEGQAPDLEAETSRPRTLTQSSRVNVVSRRRTPSRTRRVPSSTGGSYTSRTPEHQWSVFGQLMENEGQLPSPKSTSRRSQRPKSSLSVRSEYIEHQNQNPSTSSRAHVDSMVHIHSPVTEENVDDNPLDSSLGAGRTEDKSDDEYDSDSSSSALNTPSTPFTPTSPSTSSNFFRLRAPSVSVLQRNILKCAIAYFVASLFTFNPYLSSLISDMTSYGPGERKPSPSGHMVATIAVYFNPAKTMGAMVEADLFCLLGLFYSSFVCLASMSMFWWLELKPGWEWLGDVVAILWIGISMSWVAWMKVWMSGLIFTCSIPISACSMTAIIIFVVLVKEGGLQTLLQVTTIVAFGSLVSNLVCFLIWRQTATSNLQGNMTKTLDSFATLLEMLTNVFLLENETGMRRSTHDKVQKAVENHQSSFTSLKKNLSEAKSEWLYRGSSGMDGVSTSGMKSWSIGTGKEFTSRKAYEDAVDSLNRLAQHLNGLRSGTRLQYELTKAGVVGKKKRGKGKNVQLDNDLTEEDEDTAILKAAAAMFGDLMDDLGPPLKALSVVCSHTLIRLKEAFVQSQTQKHQAKERIQPQEFIDLADGIDKALVRFESTSNHALIRMYRRSEFSTQSSRTASISDFNRHASNEHPGRQDSQMNSIAIGVENEDVFLVYFFIFTLQEFARELVSLVDAMERIHNYEQLRMRRASWWGRLASWMWRTIISCRLAFKSKRGSARPTGMKRSFSAYITPEHRVVHPAFPKIRPHAPNTIQTPGRDNLNLIERVQQTLWITGKRLMERDTKYAIKAGMAIAILASPAFFDFSRPLFVAYYGDWALISFFVVISPTIGATNYLSLQRVLGTLFGATVAAAMYTLFPEDAVVLSIFGFFFSLPCFYYAVARPEYASASRFVLLTYNLTCLYCYNLRQKDVLVWDVAFHRALAVTLGVVWAALVSRFWWPAEARRELSKALSEFCLNIGWLYTRLVASNSFAPEYREETDGDHERDPENGSLIARHSATTRLGNSIHEFMAMELHLQIKLIELEGLLAQTQHEPRLKGPFPVELYRGILTSLQTILDKLHSMRCVTTREEWYTASMCDAQSVRQEFIIPVNKERREMVGNIILSFSTLASAFKLKSPLPPYLPPAEQSRQRLVAAIRQLDVVKNRDVKGSRQLLFFAYALTMKGVTQELESLGRTLQNAFGVIGQTLEEFEALFVDPKEN